MSFKETYESAQREGRVDRLMTGTYKWVEKATLIGRYLGKVKIDSKVYNMPDFYRYQFLTDDGAVDCVMSGSFDEKADELIEVGKVYAITYHGKIPISGGHTFKSFSVSRIVMPGEQAEASLPFDK